MKFKQYLKEAGTNLYDKSVKELTDMIEKDCKFFFESRPDKNDYYFRAMKKGEFGTVGVVDVRKDRNPRNTPPTIHKWLDNYFLKRFGWRTRTEGLFVSPSKSIAEDYGNEVYIVFPVGKYEAVFDPEVEDIFQLLDTDSYDILGQDVCSTMKTENALEDKEKYDKYFDSLTKLLDEKYITDVKKSFNMHGEVVVKCDKFYYIHEKDFEQMGLDKEFKKL